MITCYSTQDQINHKPLVCTEVWLTTSAGIFILSLFLLNTHMAVQQPERGITTVGFIECNKLPHYQIYLQLHKKKKKKTKQKQQLYKNKSPHHWPVCL